jgi:2-polyprenyl-6-methoxyphenol hydroxylase-like FAD-dependent oxidoreductase
MILPAETKVLVVGAGPTGLMLANQLVRRGVECLIIDRHASPSIETRALGVQARTLEIYWYLGIADRAIELGQIANAGTWWVEGRRAARLPLGDIGRGLSRYPYLLVLGQDQNELLLGELLRSRGMDIHWNTELIKIEQGSDRVLATLKRSDGSTHEISARWVGGCDGARSSVRQLNGIDFPGAPYQHVFFVADTRAEGSLAPGELNIYLWRDGFNLFFPMHGKDHWRVVGILPESLRERDDLKFDEVMPHVVRQAGSGVTFEECYWFSTYRIHHRHASRFQDRRCFVLGDAAHIHSPVGAQGMNTGLQDAYNLAWKLAYVCSGRADESLIKTYEEERLPIAQNLLKTTDNMFSVIVSDRWTSQVFRTRIVAKVFAIAMRFKRIRRLAFMTIAQIGIRYRQSSLSQNLNGFSDESPHAGDRFPWVHLKFSAHGSPEDLFHKLDDTRFNLILIGQEGDVSDFKEFVDIHVVPREPTNDQTLAAVHVPIPSFYLLRPDGYIGLAGKRFDSSAVKQYLSSRLNLRPSA